jgi:flagellar biosynthesis/type III secretory pathway M-ring protein FliF/YscJ
MMAAGFLADRGDKIEVVNIPFKSQPPEVEQFKAQAELRQWLQSPQGIGTIGGGGVVLVVLLLLLRKRRRVRIIRIEEERRAVEQQRGPAGAARIGERREASSTTAELPPGMEQGRLEGGTDDAVQLEEGSVGLTGDKIKVAADPRRDELRKIAREHKNLVVQVIRGWLKEEKRRLNTEMGAKQGEAS